MSPFVSLPTATTLPYTYKVLPSTLPPSSVPDKASGSNHVKPKFVVSSSGQAVHPDDILDSCRAVESHIDRLKGDAIKNIGHWERQITERELAEKRRVAPGWLDRNEKILQPERAAMIPQDANFEDARNPSKQSQEDNANRSDAEGAELDRAFGSTKIE